MLLNFIHPHYPTPPTHTSCYMYIVCSPAVYLRFYDMIRQFQAKWEVTTRMSNEMTPLERLNWLYTIFFFARGA